MFLLLTVRLTGGVLPYEGVWKFQTPSYGSTPPVKVHYNGVWGTVCDDFFDNVDATVACKSLDSGLIRYFSVRKRNFHDGKLFSSAGCTAAWSLTPTTEQ